jgi:hypothetical protein
VDDAVVDTRLPGSLMGCRHLRRPDALEGRVLRARDVVRAGLLIPDALRSSAWRRLFRGVYADARLPDDFGVRIRGAGLLMPPEAAFSGRTAAYLRGATGLVEAATPVEVSLPTGCRFGGVSGMRVRRTRLTAEEVTCVHGRRCTTPVRTALDIARREPLLDSVAALDLLLSRGIVARSGLHEAAAATGSLPGLRRAVRAIELADGRAESPPESRVRVLLALAGLVAVPQFVVRDEDGAFVGRVDLAFPAQRALRRRMARRPRDRGGSPRRGRADRSRQGGARQADCSEVGP